MTMDQIYARMGGVPLYAVFMRPTERYDLDTEEGAELLRAHLQRLLEMEDAGRLLAGGPLNWGEPPGDGDPIINAGGVFIIAAASREEAAAIADEDPFVVAGWRTYTVCTWKLNEGLAIPAGRAVYRSVHGHEHVP